MLKLPIAILAAAAALVPVSSAAAKAPSLKTVFHRYDRAAGRDCCTRSDAAQAHDRRLRRAYGQADHGPAWTGS